MVEFRHSLQFLRGRLLPWALEEGLGSMAEVLLTTAEADPGGFHAIFTDSCGRSLLSWTAIQGHESRVKLLIEAGADLEIRDWLGARHWQGRHKFAAKEWMDAIVFSSWERPLRYSHAA